MKKSTEKTPTMTHEFALTIDASERRLLRLKFRGLKEMYNTLLAFLLDNDLKRNQDETFIQNCKKYREIKKSIAELENAIQKIKTQKSKEEKSDQKLKLESLNSILKQNKIYLKEITDLFKEIEEKTWAYIKSLLSNFKSD